MLGNYAVGYKKPPRETQFQPGQSGNRKGRPKGSKGLKTDLREEMAERVTINEDGRSKKISKQRLMIKSMVQKAAKGDVRAQSAVLELVMRVFGVEDENTSKAKLSNTDQTILDAFLAGEGQGSGNIALKSDDEPKPDAGGSGDKGSHEGGDNAADDDEPEGGEDG